MKEIVVVIRNICPICNGDVRGNNKIKYYCKQCNILFSEKDFEKIKYKNCE